jgi:phage terminase small subunit
MKGRKPASPEEKIAKGETRPCRVNYSAPDIPPPDSLEPPKDLRGAGLDLWNEHAQRLKDVGQLRASDVPLFTQLCRTATDIATFEKRKDDPAKRMLIQLRSLYLRMSVEMGLSSVSRSKVKTVSKAAVGKPKHERFFGGIRGVIRGGKTP